MLKFLQRQDQSSSYVHRTADWIKTTYPGSAASLIPKLRQLYRAKKQAGL